MSLKESSIYCYAPDEDPYDGDEGAIWSFNYFFFNKAKKRVCYLYLRGLSIIGNDGTKTPVRAKRPASGSWSLEEETGRKRARFWFGDGEGEVQFVGVEDEEVDKEGRGVMSRLFEGGEGGTESPCKGREKSTSVLESSEETAGSNAS